MMFTTPCFLSPCDGILIFEFHVEEFNKYWLEKFVGEFPSNTSNFLGGGYYIQGLDGEATEPMIKELEEDREESQDPELEFAIAGAVRECGGLEILLGMIQVCAADL